MVGGWLVFRGRGEKYGLIEREGEGTMISLVAFVVVLAKLQLWLMKWDNDSRQLLLN